MNSQSALAKETPVHFDIPAEPADKALVEFSKQANIQILYPYSVASKHEVNALKGDYSVADALGRLLKGSGLEIATRTDATISLRAADEAEGQTSGPEASTEVVVTGTHIRGGDATSPVHTVSRNDIDRSGYSTVGEVMRSLPENFSGGQNPGVFNPAGVNDANNNASNASAVDLRGVGADATLVLVNGHRLSADSQFQGSDISGIPLAAVQRVDVVTDGASAVYGADAVVGVANFIMRRNYDGAELSARVAGATRGGGQDATVSFLAGRSSAEGFGLFNYEYDDQSAVLLGQRTKDAGAAVDDTLYQPQRRQSVFLSAGRELNDHLSVSFDALLSDRQTDQVFQQYSNTTEYWSHTWTPAYSAALSADVGLPADWKLHIVGVASGSRNASRSWESDDLKPGYSSTFNYVRYGEVTADGTLVHLPSGDVKAAIGGGYRVQGYQLDWPGSYSYLRPSRRIAYAYGEVRAPLVLASDERMGLNALDLSLSVRAERYSDLGASTNPRVGLRYVPTRDLTIRATWGTSFKAPSFDQMYSQSYVYLWDAASLGYPGSGTALMTSGGNPQLKPERSTNWTLGGEYQPSAIPNLKVSATYFSIKYRDRIVLPVANPFDFYTDPYYASFILPAPSAAAQASIISNATFYYNFSGKTYDPASVVNLLEDSYVNAAAQTVRGLDMSYRQAFSFKKARLDVFADATSLLLEQRTLPLLPEKRLSGTLGYPTQFKARGGVTWESGAIEATGIVNYVSGETDTAAIPNRPIASWTTVDANLTYQLSQKTGNGKGLRLVLAASNLLDKTPPHAVSPASAVTGVAFDSTNTSDIGRVISLTLIKAW